MTRDENSRPDNLFGLLERTVAAWPERPAFAVPSRLADGWRMGDGVWSYATFFQRVTELRDRLEAAGLPASLDSNRRVALLLGNQPEFYVHWLALNALGISIVPINPDYQREEIRYLFDTSGARLAIVLADHVASVEAAAALVDPAIQVVAHGAELKRLAPGETGAVAKTNDEAALLFTSGTTSRPKACILSNDYFLYWGERYGSEGGLISLRPGEERLLQPLPTFHINAIANAFMTMLTIGCCLIPLDRFHPRTWWDDAIDAGATCFHYLGVMPAMLMALPVAPTEKRHGMRYGMGGGIDPKQHAPFEERFGTVLCEGWAMTEIGATGLMADSHEPRSVGTRCIGKPRPHQEIRLVDESGQEIAGEGQGALQLRHAGADPRKGFFSGYLNNPDATAEAWQDDWFHTGDVVRRAADGKLHFVERKKNIIRRSGENIAPAEVELVLRRHPDVVNVAVVAIADPIREEEVAAFILPAEIVGVDEAALAEALFARCRDDLAYFKAPGLIVFVDSLPTTATQKVQRGELEALAKQIEHLPRQHDFRTRKKRTMASSSR